MYTQISTPNPQMYKIDRVDVCADVPNTHGKISAPDPHMYM